MWWVFAESVVVERGSQTTMSASLPTAIVPFFGNIPMSFAGVVAVTSTQRFSVMRFCTTRPSYRSTIRVSTPGALAEEPDPFERGGRRAAHDVAGGAAAQLGEAESARGRLALGFGRARERVPLRRRVLLGERARHEDIDDAALLGVHADETAVLGGARERLEDGPVVDHEDARIGHEEREAGHALRDQ